MGTGVWTLGRKWAGNLVPLAFWLPFFAWSLTTVVRDRTVTPVPVFIMLAGTVAAWVAMSLFGLWGNASMRRLLDARIKDQGERVFVGFASPKYTGLLDAHEDVGFLIFGKDALAFVGDSRRVEIFRDDVVRVRFRPNAHTVVGLGRWVCVEGVVKGQPVRMFVEPRERPTMLGNLWQSGTLKRKIEAWAGAGK